MSTENLNDKIDIALKAVELYEKKGKLNIPDLIDSTGFTASEIYTYFANKKAILAFYYEALVYKYQVMIEEIDGFEDYSISEKFSNFIYTMFDMLSESPVFVNDTYEKYILRNGFCSGFQTIVTNAFKDFLTSDGEIAVSAGLLMKDCFYSLLATQYLFLIRFWLKDESPEKQSSLALTDKLTSLFQEAVYNKTIDKSFDLVKYLLGTMSVGKSIPFTGGCITDFFNHREEKEHE